MAKRKRQRLIPGSSYGRAFPVIILCLSLFLGVLLRLHRLSDLDGTYLRGHDSYRYLRQSRQIVENGRMPEVDRLRWVPDGRDTKDQLILFPALLASAFKSLGPLFPSLTLESVAIFYPIAAFLLSGCVFFLLSRELFGTTVSILAVAGFSTAPSLMFRTMAGFADRDGLTLFLFMLMIFLYVKALRTKHFPRSCTVMTLSGITLGFLSLIWQGVGLVIGMVVLMNVSALFMNRFNRKDMFRFCLWFIPPGLMMLCLTELYRNVGGHVTLSAIGLPVCFIVLAITTLSVETRPSLTSKLTLRGRLPLGLAASLGLTAACALPVLVFFKDWLVDVLSLFSGRFFHPFGRSLTMLMIHELQSIRFQDWWAWFGLFLFFIIGGIIFLFNRALDPALHKKRAAIILILPFMGSLFFSRFNSGFHPAGEITGSQMLVLTTLIVFMTGMIVLRFIGHGTAESDLRADSGHIKSDLLVLIWFFVSAFMTFCARRFSLFFTPAAILAGSFFISEGFRMLKPKRRIIYWILPFVLGFVFLIGISPLPGFIRASISVTGIMTTVPEDWRRALEWIRKNTPGDAVIAAWWDYGHWINAVGQRANIVDGEPVPQRVHQMARHLFCAENEEEVLDYLEKHRASHVLITSRDIRNHTTISYVGSEGVYDRALQVDPLEFLEARASESKETDEYRFYSRQGIPFHDQILIKEIAVPVIRLEKGILLGQPRAIGARQKRDIDVTLSHLVYEGVGSDFETADYEALLWLEMEKRNQATMMRSTLLPAIEKIPLMMDLFLFGKETRHLKRIYPPYGSGQISSICIWEVQDATEENEK